jgi:enamine deaminase RidA (YjgF/YER057c/UK114 family)
MIESGSNDMRPDAAGLTSAATSQSPAVVAETRPVVPKKQAVRIVGSASANVVDLPHASWTNGFVLGNDIILSGMTAHPVSADPARPLSTYEQTCVVLDKIKALLEAADASLANITRLIVYVTDIADKDAVGRARKEYFADIGAFPASTLLGVKALVFPALTVEIEAHARRDFDLRDLAHADRPTSVCLQR